MSIETVEIRAYSGPDLVNLVGGERPAIVRLNIGPKGDDGASGSSVSAWDYKAKTNATSGYPGNGYLIWNNATQLSATSIIVSHLNDKDEDLELLLGFFTSGQKLFIQDRDDSSQNQIWLISGTPTLTGANTSTAYFTFPVTLVSSAGAAFSNNQQLLFGSISVASNSVTSATTTNFTSGQVLYANGSNVGSLSRNGIDTRTTFPNDDVTAATSESTVDTIAKRDNAGGIKFSSLRVVGGSIVMGSDGGSTTTISDSSTVDRFISTPDDDGIIALTSGFSALNASNLTTGTVSFARLVNTQTLGNLDATITAGTRDALLTAALTASRTYTLPLANAYPAGARISFADIAQTLTAANTATLTRSGSDTINGGTSVTLNTAGASPMLISDGSSKWNLDVRGVSRGGTGATTLTSGAFIIGNGSGAVTFLTPGTGVSTALAINTGSAGAIVLNGGTATNMTLAGTLTINSTTIVFGAGAAAALNTALGTQRVMRTTLATRTSGTMTADDTLVLPVLSGVTYRVKIHALGKNSASAVGMVLRLDYTSISATGSDSIGHFTNGTGNAAITPSTATYTSNIVNNASQNLSTIAEMIITPTATGNVTVTWAARTPSGSDTAGLNIGSYLETTKLS